MKLTPRMFSHLVKRHKGEQERQELLVGILASNVVNFAMAAPKEPASPVDFMPSQFGKKRQQREQTPEEVEAFIRLALEPFATVVPAAS